jgi:hypothetical protein
MGRVCVRILLGGVLRVRSSSHTGSVQASSGLYKLDFCRFWWFSWSIFGCLIDSTGYGSQLI